MNYSDDYGVVFYTKPYMGKSRPNKERRDDEDVLKQKKERKRQRQISQQRQYKRSAELVMDY